MALGDQAHATNLPSPQKPHKSTGIRSFVHRRIRSNGEALILSTQKNSREGDGHDATAVASFPKTVPAALGELQHNQQEPVPRSARTPNDGYGHDARSRSRSPVKPVGDQGPADSSRAAANGAGQLLPKLSHSSDTKPGKQNPGTNLAGLLSRPKSFKSLQHKRATEEEAARAAKDKENRTPERSLDSAPPPIYAQFSRALSNPCDQEQRPGGGLSRDAGPRGLEEDGDKASDAKIRPQCSPGTQRVRPDRNAPSSASANKNGDSTRESEPSSSSGGKSQRSRRFLALPGFGHTRSKSATARSTASEMQPALDARNMDKHLEAMLDRRNIPENQRYKMRNLNNTIKMEFIRQDWAEMQAAKPDRSSAAESVSSAGAASAALGDSETEEEKPRRGRGRSFTFSRARKGSVSPSKKQKPEGTLGRHFRSKSTESFVSERGAPSVSSSPGGGASSKSKPQPGPVEYVAYLRKVQKPELVEVGKLHKLRLLLRNETVAWIEEFMDQGGMKEIVDLLKRIMEVEWREEHEDALLHENLLCLKALSTTARAMEYLDSIQADLFSQLLGMLFDPERKGPSEFTTRNIITSVLFAYIASARPSERGSRAHKVLDHLRDPDPKEEERPLPFVLEMRRERPYRVWCKEAVSVTKEVFWIFLHNLNVVALPSDGAPPHRGAADAGAQPPGREQPPQHAYMMRHFPQERPPVPAAPYVGGVEWDATNYLASHLDLLNAIVACTPSAERRNALRAELRISGWERCLGGSLRLCKEKFYGSVHDGLRTWVAAAAEDGWEVREVRYGPPKRVGGGGGQRKTAEPAPKLQMPKLDFEMDKPGAPEDVWL